MASIVEGEAASDEERPIVASVMYNRLNNWENPVLGMDSTVYYGCLLLGEKFSTEIDSPYNTYRYAGLPPGPIKVASVAGIDAVLNAPVHNYLYMCAKEDFSGAHNFASTFSEHQQNARRYVEALNARGIR